MAARALHGDAIPDVQQHQLTLLAQNVKSEVQRSRATGVSENGRFRPSFSLSHSPK
jgi:hypothetical protein